MIIEVDIFDIDLDETITLTSPSRCDAESIEQFNKKFESQAFACIQPSKFPGTHEIIFLSKVWPEEDPEENLSAFLVESEALSFMRELRSIPEPTQ